MTNFSIKEFVAYVDFGSDCTLMRESEASSLNLYADYNTLPVIKGFGNSLVIPSYKSQATLRIDELEAQVEILVVKDDFLQTALLVGQNFTELPFVTVLKNNNLLLFYECPNVNTPIIDDTFKLHLSNDTEIQKVNLVDIYLDDSKFTGSIYVEGYYNGRPELEYRLHRGVYSIKEGKGQLILTNLTNKRIMLKANVILARATPVLERTIKLF